MDERAASIDRMYTDIEWALSQGLALGQVVPMLERMLGEAEPGSAHAHYAKRQLAELIVRREPFRAARLSREILRDNRDDDRAHAALGLACLLMGHYKMAERAYRTALGLVPHCPWYAHNLGHLLDVAMGRPHEALPLLKLSRRAMPQEPEIAISYAHALYHASRTDEALRELRAALDGDEPKAQELLRDWAAGRGPGKPRVR